MLGAVLYAHQEMQVVIMAIEELVREAGKPRWEWQPPAINEPLYAALQAAFADEVAGRLSHHRQEPAPRPTRSTARAGHRGADRQ